MTYFTFLVVVLLPPILVLGTMVYRVRGGLNLGSALRAVVFLVVIAVVYTTPWDNYLIYRGVWSYGEDRVLGVIGFVPVEEYGFMALQALMTGLITLWMYRGVDRTEAVSRPVYLAGLAVWIAVTVCGVWMLVSGADRWLYLGLILAWAGPVLAGTWWLGGRRFGTIGWRYVAACGIPSVYLWVWDAFAIGDGIWEISDWYTVGLEPGGLPIEEAMFFLLTNVLVVHGVLLFWKTSLYMKNP
ncbi:MAG: lycopene cyclase domain-containing protein [Rhodothermales bacterium]|nr:lycopene cyclase domain-containing protein [Rhodothermales bacterium]